MTANETAHPLRSRRTHVVLGAIAVVLAVILAVLLISARVAADADAKADAVQALGVANATLESLAGNDARAQYDATLATAQSYSADAAYEITWMSGQLDAATLAEYVDATAALDAAIDASAPGTPAESQQFDAADDSLEAYAQATAKANEAIAAASSQNELTAAATVDLEHAIVAADSALVAVAQTVAAAADALIASHPDWDAWHVNFVNESAGAVQQYLDRRAAGLSDSELVQQLGDELLFTTYLTTPLTQFSILVKSYAV